MKTKKSFKSCLRSSVFISICFSCIVNTSAQQQCWNDIQLGDEANAKGKYETALQHYLSAANCFTNNNHKANCFVFAGNMCINLKDYENAFKYYELSAQLYNDDYYIARSDLFAGYAKYELKQYIEAAGYFHYAVEIAESKKYYDLAGYACDGAGHALKFTEWESAKYYWNQAGENFNKVDKAYTIPSELQIEIAAPSTNKLRVGKDLFPKSDLFNQGEAVLIRGSVLFKGKSVGPKGNRMTIILDVPGCNLPINNRQTYIEYIQLDETGSFTFIPFAGWNKGRYTIILYAQYIFEEDQKLFSGCDSSLINVQSGELSADINSPTNEIIKKYKEVISKGPIHTNPDARNHVNNTITGMILSSSPPWGYLHNHCLDGTQYDPHHNFTCEGYQSQVLTFFDHLRFNSDPDIRALMNGLDYGPIQRNTVISSVWEAADPYFHVAVVLYRIGMDWKTDPQALVFDPWFEQEPWIYTMEQWKKKNTWIIPFEPTVDRQMLLRTKPLWDGFPITNNAICSGFNSIYSNQFMPNVKKKTNTMIHCPVTILITNSEGKKTGIKPDGNFIQDFVTTVYAPDENNDTSGWFFELPEDSYEIQITGTDDGEFHVHISGELVENGFLNYGAQPISKDKTATITLGPDIDKPILILPDGTEIEPVSEPIGIYDVLTKNHDNVITHNHPNPFSETTMILFHLPRNTHVKIEVFDISGKNINTLMDAYQNAGEHTILWNGTDESGASVQCGIYFYKISTDNYALTNKMFLIR
ncbi:MAG: T9SS type A sorting domain-containing protein [Bacteroidales bacterium]|nr:T9SS type A sorting domain-containing protein [Bacteroidales bacterium]